MTENGLTMGVVGTAFKENELRAPIYPAHLSRIDEKWRQRIYLEEGYGRRFGVSDAALAEQVAGLLPRAELFARSDVILLPKPTEADFPYFHEGQILWGWPHCVQGEAITQAAIDKRMTLIAWEEMHLWRKDNWDLHIFHKNNEMAGYCSVLHALQLAGITGHFGPRRRAAVLSFGSTGRGAVHALQAQGFHDITVFSQRPYYGVGKQIPGVRYRLYRRAEPGSPRLKVRAGDGYVPLAEYLAQFDIVVNCVLQNTDRPVMFIEGREIDRFAPGSLIVDVSCDEGMGFDFARPTSFEDPAFTVDNDVLYYAVDHSPSYLWRAATYEISMALLPFIPAVMAGRDTWQANATIHKAIEIDNGVIRNERILRFQNRAPDYPHDPLPKANG